jgi:translocation and assembly module TamB
LALNWKVELVDNGDFYGRLSIPDVRSENKKVDGEVNIDNINLNFLSPMLGEYNKINAVVNSKASFSGPIKRPRIDGFLSLKNLLIKGDASPIEVQKGEMNLSFSGYRASLKSTMGTPEGDLHVTGQANWRRPEKWSSTIRVFADELLLNIPPTTKVKVKPDMVLSLSPQSAKIKGNIDLPWGQIILEELPPNAIGVSKDQVILDKQLKPLETTHALPFDIESDINIRIGNEFQLSAFGLEGRLTGQLNVSQRDLGPYVVGEVNIQEGSYRSFGQDLIIEEGKILMNGPIDQPFVQIKAIRNPDNTQDGVTAGIRVTGPANQPKVEIFSDRSLSQARELSYLLRGQDIDGETGGNAVTTTLIGLSLAQSGQVVGKIGEAFGVQNLQLDTKGAGEESQVTVSGYILPGLRVKYGVGIFDSVGEFTVRYRLMTNLYLDAISGVDRAVDLIYQFEFN